MSRRITPAPWNLEPSDGDYGLYRLNKQQDSQDTSCDAGNAALMNAAPYLLQAANNVLANWGQGDIAAAVRELAAAVKMANKRTRRNEFS